MNRKVSVRLACLSFDVHPWNKKSCRAATTVLRAYEYYWEYLKTTRFPFELKRMNERVSDRITYNWRWKVVFAMHRRNQLLFFLFDEFLSEQFCLTNMLSEWEMQQLFYSHSWYADVLLKSSDLAQREEVKETDPHYTVGIPLGKGFYPQPHQWGYMTKLCLDGIWGRCFFPFH